MRFFKRAIMSHSFGLLSRAAEKLTNVCSTVEERRFSAA